MAKKKEAQKPPDSVLVAAAKTIGEAAGVIAAAVGIAAPQKPKAPKLVTRNKSRLPRRQKKTVQKAANKAKLTGRIKATG
jgi:hypothetical protein